MYPSTHWTFPQSLIFLESKSSPAPGLNIDTQEELCRGLQSAASTLSVAGCLQSPSRPALCWWWGWPGRLSWRQWRSSHHQAGHCLYLHWHHQLGQGVRTLFGEYFWNFFISKFALILSKICHSVSHDNGIISVLSTSSHHHTDTSLLPSLASFHPYPAF